MIDLESAMAGEAYVIVSGNLTAPPKHGTSRTGTPWARLRVASTVRFFNRADSQWQDGDTVFLEVTCWRRLAENVVASLERGDRVVVSGRLKQRSYEDTQGGRHTVTELEADSVGVDLSRMPARLLRPAPKPEPTTSDPAEPAEATTSWPNPALAAVPAGVSAGDAAGGTADT